MTENEHEIVGKNKAESIYQHPLQPLSPRRTSTYEISPKPLISIGSNAANAAVYVQEEEGNQAATDGATNGIPKNV